MGFSHINLSTAHYDTNSVDRYNMIKPVIPYMFGKIKMTINYTKKKRLMTQLPISMSSAPDDIIGNFTTFEG